MQPLCYSQSTMPRPPLSVTIITLNEEKNLPRALESVRWADEVLVVDSGSTDRTTEIARTLGAKVIINPWPGYGKQKNFAHSKVTHDWVLSLDADEEVSIELRDEILKTLEGSLSDNPQVAGYELARVTYYLGRWIYHGGWYPNYAGRLADRRLSAWTEPSVHEKLEIKGRIKRLQHPIRHYTFESIQEQVLTNVNFSRLGFEDLRRRGISASLVLLVFKPIGKFLETYVLKRGFLDGVAGFIISVNAAHSMFLKYAYLTEAQISNESPDSRQHNR